MNIYKSLNQMIDYIEENLENEIEYTKLAKILGVNEYVMKNVFSLICDMSISTYIRKRRLSNAGFDLYSGNSEKIVDIAEKYQYENPTAFSRAFEKFHGIKPSKVKKNPNGLKIFPKIVFDESIEEYDNNIEYSIIEKEEIILYGIGLKTNEEHIFDDAPRFWTEMYEKYSDIDLNFGMVVYENRFKSSNCEYWVLYDKKVEYFNKYIIPKSKWLKFIIPTQDYKAIQEMSRKFYEKVVPVLKYEIREIPELEYYHDDIVEFLVPIRN